MGQFLSLKSLDVAPLLFTFIIFQVLIIGPSDTLYEGGFFKCHLIFPKEYPLRPPKLKVITDIWHPNIDQKGDVCISILHEPGDYYIQNPKYCVLVHYISKKAVIYLKPN